MSRYERLRAAVVQVLDTELGHDADGIRRMLTQALEHDDEATAESGDGRAVVVEAGEPSDRGDVRETYVPRTSAARTAAAVSEPGTETAGQSGRGTGAGSLPGGATTEYTSGCPTPGSLSAVESAGGTPPAPATGKDLRGDSVAVGTAAATQMAWLIERGQPENHAPTVWWAGGREVGWGGWTPDAWQAVRYATKADADKVIDESFRGAHLSGPPTAHAVEHGFVTAPRNRWEPIVAPEAVVESLPPLPPPNVSPETSRGTPTGSARLPEPDVRSGTAALSEPSIEGKAPATAGKQSTPEGDGSLSAGKNAATERDEALRQLAVWRDSSQARYERAEKAERSVGRLEEALRAALAIADEVEDEGLGATFARMCGVLRAALKADAGSPA